MPVIQGIVDCMSSIQSLAVWTLARNWNARNEGSSVISPWGRSGPSGCGWQAVRAGLGLQGWGTAVRMLGRRTIVGSGRAGHAADANGGGTRPFTGRGGLRV